MAAHYEHERLEEKECANCAVTEGLGLCSRCHTAWFCSVKCQKAYWPFHKEFCRRNDFADMLEKDEPKFARWMRKHGKQAVLKDDEVDRVERKLTTIANMYGKADPRPAPPEYTAEDRRRMALAEEEEMLEARRLTARDKHWAAIDMPAGLSLDCGPYKWRQDQSRVEIFVPLAEGLGARHVCVELSPAALRLVIAGRELLAGPLFRAIKAEESTWLIRDHILEISLLKRSRRGHYDDGHTNYSTYWRSVLAAAPPAAMLPAPPPSDYYTSEWEAPDEGASAAAIVRTSDRPMIDRSRERAW